MANAIKKCRRTFRRHLVDGSTVPEFTWQKAFQIGTKCPAKWLLVDLETAQVWRTDRRMHWRLFGHVRHEKDKGYIIQ